MLKAEIKGKKLLIEIDLQPAAASASGKTNVIASTHGNQPTTLIVDGKPVTIGLNAYYRNS